MKAPSIDDFVIVKAISRGAFGKVFLAYKNDRPERKLAIKVMKKADLVNKNMTYQVVRERNALAITRSPFCVHLYYFLQSPDSVYLVMEYLIGGDLKSLLAEYQIFDQKMAVFYVSEIVLALEYLHRHGIVHRDLKPDNMLLTADGHLKLTDFGLSKVNVHRELQVADLVGTTPFVQRCQAPLRTPGQIISLTSKISFTAQKLEPRRTPVPDISLHSDSGNKSPFSADGSMTGLEPLKHSPTSDSSFIHSRPDFYSNTSFRIPSESSFEQLRQVDHSERIGLSVRSIDHTSESLKPELCLKSPQKDAVILSPSGKFSITNMNSICSPTSSIPSAIMSPREEPYIHISHLDSITAKQDRNLLCVPDSWTKVLSSPGCEVPVVDISPQMDCQESPVRVAEVCSCCPVPGSSVFQTPNREDPMVLTSSPTYVTASSSSYCDWQNSPVGDLQSMRQQEMTSPEVLRHYGNQFDIVDKFIETVEQSLNCTDVWPTSPSEPEARKQKPESFKKPETRKKIRKRKLGMQRSPEAKRQKIVNSGLTERLFTVKVSEASEKPKVFLPEDRKPLADVSNVARTNTSTLQVPAVDNFKRLSKNTSHLSLMETTDLSHCMSDTKESNVGRSDKHGSCFSEPRLSSPKMRTPFRHRKDTQDSQYSDGCILGTPDYLAPELLLKSHIHGPAVDWWSLGVCLYEFLLGCPPFNDETPDLIFANILRRCIEFPPEDDDCLSPEAREVIEVLLHLDPSLRADGVALRSMSLFRQVDWANLHNVPAPFIPQPRNDCDTGYFQARNTLQNLDVSSLTP